MTSMLGSWLHALPSEFASEVPTSVFALDIGSEG